MDIGWWYGHVKGKNVFGFFPGSYVQKVTKNVKQKPELPKRRKKRSLALYRYVSHIWKKSKFDSYEKDGENELTVTQGEELEILKKTENWIQVKNSKGEIGWVPSNYLSEEKST